MNITKVQRAPEGYWTARVAGHPVVRRFGSWGTPPDETGRWHDVKPEIAARIQAKVRSFERAEKNAAAAS